jgi:hypothetical protein
MSIYIHICRYTSKTIINKVVLTENKNFLCWDCGEQEWMFATHILQSFLLCTAPFGWSKGSGIVTPFFILSFFLPGASRSAMWLGSQLQYLSAALLASMSEGGMWSSPTTIHSRAIHFVHSKGKVTPCQGPWCLLCCPLGRHGDSIEVLFLSMPWGRVPVGSMQSTTHESGILRPSFHMISHSWWGSHWLTMVTFEF